jgi:hypothetical protein
MVEMSLGFVLELDLVLVATHPLGYVSILPPLSSNQNAFHIHSTIELQHRYEIRLSGPGATAESTVYCGQ